VLTHLIYIGTLSTAIRLHITTRLTIGGQLLQIGKLQKMVTLRALFAVALLLAIVSVAAGVQQHNPLIAALAVQENAQIHSKMTHVSSLSSDHVVSVHAITSALPGGGKLYVYKLPDGTVERVPTPPANFRPATANAATLAEYDFPPRPAGGSKLATWERSMQAFKSDAPPPAAITITAQGGIRSNDVCGTDSGYACNWGGYYMDAPSGYSYEAADEVNTAPNVTNNGTCLESGIVPRASIWVGLGGVGTDLVQQGIEWCNGPTLPIQPRWYPFEEFVPGEHVAFCGYSTWYMPEGDVVNNALRFGASNNPPLAVFWMENNTTGVAHSCDVNVQSSWNFTFDGSTADFITEEQVNDGSDGLAKYADFTTQNDSAETSLAGGTWYSLASQTHSRLITGCPTSYTQVPQAIGSDQESFIMKWNAYRYSCS